MAKQDSPRPAESSAAFREFTQKIGLGELRPEEVVSRFIGLRKQTQIGLKREGDPTREDGGLLAIRTGIPVVTPKTWSKVPVGSRAFVADVAGTNWNIMRATKEQDGSVSLSETSNQSYHDGKRHVTFDDFVGRIAYPIAGEIIENGDIDELTDIGISFGFAHTNTPSRDGIDANLIDVKADGSLVKEWRITDWDPKTQTNLTKAVKAKLGELGIMVRTVVAINDTPAVALDGGAVQEASNQGLEVIPAGFVGGTGTNGAVNNDGLVNLEIGHAAWPEDEIFKRMKINGWTKVEEPELEPETGMYLPLRLAAGIQLLHEQDATFPLDEQLVEELTSADPNKDQELISKIALGERETSPEVQDLARIVLKRAGQVYGIMLATIAETTPSPTPEVEQDTPRAFLAEGETFLKGYGVKRAFLAEGGTLLKGYGVKTMAEKTAADLNEPISLVEAKGLRGVGALAMAYLHIAA